MSIFAGCVIHGEVVLDDGNQVQCDESEGQEVDQGQAGTMAQCVDDCSLENVAAAVSVALSSVDRLAKNVMVKYTDSW
jgi:hypothetical protein